MLTGQVVFINLKTLLMNILSCFFLPDFFCLSVERDIFLRSKTNKNYFELHSSSLFWRLIEKEVNNVMMSQIDLKVKGQTFSYLILKH